MKSSFKGSDEGSWGWTAGKNYGDPDNKGLQTTTDYRWYDISSKTKDFNNKGKTLVLQYTVKHEQNLDCGGGYIKLAPKGVDQDKFGGDSDYSIMFGPDICGYSTKKVHVIFTYKGKNHLIKREIKPETDEKTHIYTLILKPDNTYSVQIDLKEVQSGSLYDDWDMLEPKMIKDPKASKPEVSGTGDDVCHFFFLASFSRGFLAFEKHDAYLYSSLFFSSPSPLIFAHCRCYQAYSATVFI